MSYSSLKLRQVCVCVCVEGAGGIKLCVRGKGSKPAEVLMRQERHVLMS